ncbi:MAG TPA: hypothetical protein PK029_02390 [Bacteroidales bacterium]|nr:MAG: hypothetical protein BWY22_00172 [Bacteroidetes bacterium ADurb.Bin217]HPH15992.1 hypothetical protein [Bacteroidales bacterium]HPM12737.1 hypothetical protein [Bacteroidales bacterium]
MKKHLPLILGIFGIFSLVFVSCDETPFCMDCDSEGIIKKTVSYGDSASITIYPVMTPLNYNHCDSFVLYNGTYIEPYKAPQYKDSLKLCTAKEAQEDANKGIYLCVCRENPDIQYNDDVKDINNNQGINNFFYIQGINKFPKNKLFIKVQDDTTKIRTYVNYDNISDKFTGLVLDTMDIEYTNSRMLRSGVYVYELVLYGSADVNHQVPLDTIAGKFLIVRSLDDCNNNCLKHAYNQNDTKLLK